MNTLETVGIIVGIIVGVGTIIWALPQIYNWFQTPIFFLKRAEYGRLRTIEVGHQKCAAKYTKVTSELDGLYETCAPYLEQKRRELSGIALGLSSQKDLEEIEKPPSGGLRLSEALRPLETNLYFDPRLIPKRPR